MTARFTVERVGDRVGVLDHERRQFAPFNEVDLPYVQPARVRAARTVVRLLSGADTTTGYVWEKTPHLGAESETTS